jgi:hypothetical protein
MKYFLVVLMIFSNLALANDMLGEQNEPQCGEPCSVCAGGIKKCDKTQANETSRQSENRDGVGGGHTPTPASDKSSGQ